MVRFSHSVFALPFALIAAFMAAADAGDTAPSPGQLLLIVACMVTARSFAMTFNRIADAAIDARNPRTANRPLQTGAISLRQAFTFLFASGLLFIAACYGFHRFFDNAWPLYLSAPTLGLVAGYSYCKRFTTLAHFALGLAIGFSPIAAWIAIHPASLDLRAVLLAGVVLFWIAGFDIIYACQDVEADRRDGLFSLPARLGIARALLLSRACHVVTSGLLVGLGFAAGLSWLYWSAAGVTTILLAAEQRLVSPNDLSRVNLAFFTLNGLVSLLLAGATIADLIWLAAGR